MAKEQAVPLSDLECDDRYIAIGAAFDSIDSLDPDAEPRRQQLGWSSLVTSATQLLEQWPDLRVALWLTRGLVETSGLAGLASGLGHIVEVLARTPSVPPACALDQDSAALVLAWLGMPDAVARIGKLGVHEGANLDIASAATRDNAQRALLPLDAQAVGWIANAIEALEAVEHSVNIEGADFQLDTSVLRDMLVAASRQHVAQATEIPPETGQHFTSTRQEAAERAEVMRRIDELIGWFHRHEPGHPAPLLLGRIRRCMGMDFLQLVDELMPDARTGVEVIFGKDRDTQS
jgi:type VI secretion system protein ImpA